MIVLAQFGMVDAPASRHPEMEDHRVVTVGMNQPIFRATAEAGDLCPGQPLSEILGKGSTQVRPAHLDPSDPPAVQHALEAAHGRFDFG